MTRLRHLLGIASLPSDGIDEILERANVYFALSRGDKKCSVLRGKTVVNLFFENSTRTRSSFELAGKRLGADVINVSASSSSLSKGESLLDTVRTLDAMRADVIVVRHASAGVPLFLSQRCKAAIVNAGDGAHEHPTQALLDAFTILKRKGRLGGLTVAICGDIANSRVARSNALLLAAKGSRVRLCGPKTLLPARAAAIAEGVVVTHRLHEAVEGADVVMMLRIQNERLASAALATTREYSRTFGLTPAALSHAKSDAIVMHPGPMIRGVELDSDLADGPRSVVLDQVEAGVAVRAAVLEMLCA